MSLNKIKNFLSGEQMNTYVFQVELEEEEGVWTAVVPILPGCNAWGHTKEDALTAVQENAKAYIETLIEDSQPIPVEQEEIRLPLKVPAVAIAI